MEEHAGSIFLPLIEHYSRPLLCASPQLAFQGSVWIRGMGSVRSEREREGTSRKPFHSISLPSIATHSPPEAPKTTKRLTGALVSDLALNPAQPELRFFAGKGEVGLAMVCFFKKFQFGSNNKATPAPKHTVYTCICFKD